MAVEESSFPRGGSTPENVTASSKTNLFDQLQKKKTKTKKNQVRHHVVTGAEPKLTSLTDLSYKGLTEGMLVLGQVTEITDYYLQVSMPGLTVGRVPITQISEPYSKLLQSTGQNDENIEALCPLSELFYKGQLVTAHVWQIRKTEEMRHLVSLSLDPSAVHTAWSHTTMAKEGLIITAAVKSREEHGYVMDCGVNGLRCFLKEDKSTNYCNTFNGGRPLAIGQLVRCVITKAEGSQVASKIEISADPYDIAEQEKAGYQAVDKQLILPGMRFKLTVTEPMQDGLEVKFFGLTGYIHRNHIPSLDSQQSIEAGTTLFGRVLYVTALVKNVYFSALTNVCNTVEEIPKPSPAEIHFNVGDTVESAKITGVGGKGIFLRLGRKNLNVRGFVPERRIGFNYKGKMEDNDDETTMLQRLRSKFPVGNSVRCRLLFFDTLSSTYICSMEKSVLEEKYLTYSDVQVGSVVPCMVEGIRNGGIHVKVGMLNGFVPATHSADIPLHQPAKKFQPGTKISGRVLKVDLEKHKLIVTLKQTLVSSGEPIIASYQSPRIGVCYTGTAVAITPTGVYVSFFGDVKGLLEINSQCVPEDHKFFLGQLLKCYVIKRSNNQLRLSLIPPAVFKHDKTASKLLNIGQCYNLEVVSVSSNGLQVRVIDEDSYNASGIIPVYHLSDDPHMCLLLLNTFEVGTVVTNVWCFSNGNGSSFQPIVFSMRSSVIQFFKSTQGKIATKKSIEAVCPGWVLPCSIKKIESKYLLLEVPLASLEGLVKVSHQNVCEEGETIASLGLIEGQGIQAKVVSVLDKKNTLLLDCKRSKIWNKDLETCILHLSKYISDQQRLLAHAIKAGEPLGLYHIGKDVSGVVSEQTEWGFILQLSNGARGEMTFFNAHSDNLEIGTRVNGKVLNVDCLRGHVEITLRKEICSTLKRQSNENLPDLKLDVQLRGPALLVTPEFVLIQLKGSGKFNLAYIPTHLYPYGKSELTVSEPFFGVDRKVIIKRFTNRIIICLPKEIVKSYQKKIKSNSNKKQARYFKIKEEKEEDESKRILDSQTDPKIIDKDEDDISEEEFDDLQDEESESEAEWSNIAEEQNLLLVDNKENFSQDENARKRKSDRPFVNDKSVSPPKKSKQENESEDNVVSKLEKKKKKTDCSNESNGVQVVEKKKKHKEKIVKDNDESDDVQVVVTKKKKRKLEMKSEADSDSKHEIASGKPDNVDSTSVKKPTLKNPGFLWDIDPAKFMQVLEPGKHQASSDDDEDDSDDETSKKKKRKKTVAERREVARLEEERLQKVEKELLDPNRQLTSCDDFDRMVLANPDSSSVWLQYMAFHLQATEIEKARAVAQRAIKSISYREEQEKLNVWLGLLNLENLYGTSDSLKTILDEALQFNDPYKIRAHMVRIYAESAKNKELESEVRLVLKKFKDTPVMWQEIGSILMNHGYAEKARSIMQQALQHLKNKKDSVSLIVQFALMEARNNSFEQAKAMMDPILVSYPQRIDIWCTYCDMLVKANQITEARELLERSVSQKLPARKMKTLFTKYLQFEQAHGSKESQDKVKAKASEYVKQVAGGEPMVDE